jgi:hypothetical protein
VGEKAYVSNSSPKFRKALTAILSYLISTTTTTESTLHPNFIFIQHPVASYKDMPSYTKLPGVAPEAEPSPTISTASPLSTYQILVGDIDANPTPGVTPSLYQDILNEERSSTRWFYLTAVLMYNLIAAQIVLCLGIALGSQQSLTMDQIALLAAVNTGVAVGIAVLKGFALPEKKGTERLKLKRLAERIRVTTRRLQAGLVVDVKEEAEAVRTEYEQAEDEAHFHIQDVLAAAEGGLAAAKAGGKQN